MTRLFVVFRTFDRIWTCKTYTRELAPFEMDMSNGPIKLMFMVDQIALAPGGKDMYVLNSHFFRRNSIATRDTISFYCQPHDAFLPKILQPCKEKPVTLSPTNGARHGLMRRFSLPSLELDIEAEPTTNNGSNTTECVAYPDVIYFVLPMYRCTVLLDAHTASCVSNEYSLSRTFRRHFWHYILRHGGFRNCVPDYEEWTQEEREAWDNYLSVPYMIDIVSVWPKQKIDYAWSLRILDLLNKQVVLEEGFAWLSTLGGAHSSLGETFRHHAERAGEISGQQLRLAIQLGNESLIARCYIFWSWSLLQRGQLKRCKTCVLNTWKFCQGIKGRDTILENMCKAVWSRLKYKRSQLKAKTRHCRKDKDSHKDRDEDGGGGDNSRSGKNNVGVTSSGSSRNMDESTSSTSSTTNDSRGSSSVCKETTAAKGPARLVNTVRVH